MTSSPASSEAILTADEFWELPDAPHGEGFALNLAELFAE